MSVESVPESQEHKIIMFNIPLHAAYLSGVCLCVFSCYYEKSSWSFMPRNVFIIMIFIGKATWIWLYKPKIPMFITLHCTAFPFESVFSLAIAVYLSWVWWNFLFLLSLSESVFLCFNVIAMFQVSILIALLFLPLSLLHFLTPFLTYALNQCHMMLSMQTCLVFNLSFED